LSHRARTTPPPLQHQPRRARHAYAARRVGEARVGERRGVGQGGAQEDEVAARDGGAERKELAPGGAWAEGARARARAEAAGKKKKRKNLPAP
jgi:hypothetical protein